MASLATVPLEKLPVISVDLETTGLRPAHDRIVQIGACDPWDETTVLDGLVHLGKAGSHIQPLSIILMTPWLKAQKPCLWLCQN